ncbi:unnamed protein product, partial [Notodromas monacha]
MPEEVLRSISQRTPNGSNECVVCGEICACNSANVRLLTRTDVREFLWKAGVFEKSSLENGRVELCHRCLAIVVTGDQLLWRYWEKIALCSSLLSERGRSSVTEKSLDKSSASFQSEDTFSAVKVEELDSEIPQSSSRGLQGIKPDIQERWSIRNPCMRNPLPYECIGIAKKQSYRIENFTFLKERAFKGQSNLIHVRCDHHRDKKVKCGVRGVINLHEQVFFYSSTCSAADHNHGKDKSEPKSELDGVSRSAGDSEDVIRHDKKISGTPEYFCDSCERSFESQRNLTLHREEHVMKCLDRVSCISCCEVLRLEELNEHVETSHGGLLARSNTERVKLGMKLMDCHICNFRTVSSKVLQSHKVQKHRGDSESSSGEGVCPEASANLKCSNDLVCSICGLRFSQLTTFEEHVSNCAASRSPEKCPVKDERLPGFESLSLSFESSVKTESFFEAELMHDFNIGEKNVDDMASNLMEVDPLEEDLLSSAGDVHQANVSGKPAKRIPAVKKQRRGRREKIHYVCELCGHASLKFACLYRHHLKAHAVPNGFECNACGRSFPTSSQLQTHTERHLLDVRDKIVCITCRNVVSFSGLSHHVRYKHKGRIGRTEAEREKIGVRFRKCALCLFKTTVEGVFETHVLQAHRNQSAYPCEDCEESFANAATLDLHRNVVHLRERPRVCGFCGEEFYDRRKFDSHMERHKELGGRKLCPECGKVLCGRALKEHLAAAHGRGVCCKICSSEFPTYYAMRTHMAKEHGAPKLKKKVPKVYLCGVCGKTCSPKSIYLEHMKVEHDVTLPGLKEFKCEFCFKLFYSGERYRAHQKGAHGLKRLSQVKCGLICSLCSLSFPEKVVFRDHLRDEHMVFANMDFEQKFSLCLICRSPAMDGNSVFQVKLQSCENVSQFLCKNEIFRRETIETSASGMCDRCLALVLTGDRLMLCVQRNLKQFKDLIMGNVEHKPPEVKYPRIGKDDHDLLHVRCLFRRVTGVECPVGGVINLREKLFYYHQIYSAVNHCHVEKEVPANAVFMTSASESVRRSLPDRNAQKDFMRCHLPTGKKGYKCELCDYKIRQFKSLCTACCYCFLALHEHVKLKHCGKIGRTKDERLALGIKARQCLRCSFVGMTETAFGIHAALEHREEQVIKCDECDKEFKTQRTLRDHENSVHGKKTYECAECGLVNSSRTAYERHLETHKPMKGMKLCPQCGKALRAGSLLGHMIVFHNHP